MSRSVPKPVTIRSVFRSARALALNAAPSRPQEPRRFTADERETFPDLWKKPTADGHAVVLLSTTANLEHACAVLGVQLGYDVIAKRLTTNLCAEPEGISLIDMLSQWFHRLWLLNGIRGGDLAAMIAAVAAGNATNPAVDYLSSLKWDVASRFAAVAACLQGPAIALSEAAIRMLFVQLCAAADHAARSPHDPQFDVVVVLQGPQGIGKSRFFRSLMPPELALYYRGGLSLDPANKDSVLAAISALVVELGELDGTFRKADVAALKAFLSLHDDLIRRPYGRGHERMPRRTAFVGTVNTPDFLADETGSRRFVPVPVDAIDFAALAAIPLEQVLAEGWQRYISGEQWWPTSAELQVIAPVRAAHERMRPEEERLLAAL